MLLNKFTSVIDHATMIHPTKMFYAQVANPALMANRTQVIDLAMTVLNALLLAYHAQAVDHALPARLSCHAHTFSMVHVCASPPLVCPAHVHTARPRNAAMTRLIS